MLSREIIIALCASTLFVGSGASPRPMEPILSEGNMALEARQDEPAAPELAAPENPDEAEGPGDAPPASLCSRFNLKKLREDPGERKRLWDASGAGVLADEYINEHGWEFWVMDLDEKIFGDKGSASDHWDCRDKGGLCNIEKECPDYEDTEQGVAGYYLFYALTQFKSFVNSYHFHLKDEKINGALDIQGIQDDFAVGPPDDTNPAAILSGVTGMLGAVAGPAGSVFGVASSAAGLAGAFAKKPAPPSNGGRKLADRVLNQFTHLYDFIEGANRGVFGVVKDGANNNPDEITPAEMQRQTYGNPSVRALGDGQWLNPDPTRGLEGMMDEMYNRMRQVLAWTMIRDTGRAFIFADRPIDEGKCKDDSGAWDPAEKVCLRLFKATGTKDHDGVKPIDAEVVKKITGPPYNLDLLAATKNAFNCWKDHDRKPAHPENSPELEVGQLPGCLFGMAVASGTLEPRGVKMDGWAGQRDGKMWSAYDNRV